MSKNNLLKNLLIINLVFLAILLFGKMVFIHKFIRILFKSFLTPFLFSIFLFYIIKPLNTIFTKNGLKPSASALLTLIISIFTSAGIGTYFSRYILLQLNGITTEIMNIWGSSSPINGFISEVNKYIPINDVYKSFTTITNTYTKNLGFSIMFIINYVMHVFSTILLILVILYYLLKDSSKFKDRIICLIPDRYKKVISKILSDSDTILGAYVTGQAKVALALSLMIFIGYKIIGMPNALIFSSITFILAFIPFIGFFISMIIPSIIALSLGLMMVTKLAIVFLIVQTLKGRVVVPAIMSHAMKIHPLTDIVLVIGAVAVGGPLAAFAIVPIYAIIKTILSNLYECHII